MKKAISGELRRSRSRSRLKSRSKPRSRSPRPRTRSNRPRSQHSRSRSQRSRRSISPHLGCSQHSGCSQHLERSISHRPRSRQGLFFKSELEIASYVAERPDLLKLINQMAQYSETNTSIGIPSSSNITFTSVLNQTVRRLFYNSS